MKTSLVPNRTHSTIGSDRRNQVSDLQIHRLRVDIVDCPVIVFWLTRDFLVPQLAYTQFVTIWAIITTHAMPIGQAICLASAPTRPQDQSADSGDSYYVVRTNQSPGEYPVITSIQQPLTPIASTTNRR